MMRPATSDTTYRASAGVRGRAVVSEGRGIGISDAGRGTAATCGDSGSAVALVGRVEVGAPGSGPSGAGADGDWAAAGEDSSGSTGGGPSPTAATRACSGAPGRVAASGGAGTAAMGAAVGC